LRKTLNIKSFMGREIMKFRQLCFVVVAVVLGLGLLAPSVSSAKWPDRPITLIIPYVPGATGDITARMLADEMEKILGVKIIPSNKPGASAVLGTDAAVRAKKDGYTLVYAGASALVYAPITNPQIVKYDPFKDLEPLGFHYYFPQGIGVKADAPWKNFQEMVEHAKKNPGQIRVSTIGVGSTPHFVLEMIQSITGTKMTHVPFEGGESVVTAVMGGHVEATCDGFAKIKPHMEAGRMRFLLTTTKLPGYPQFPTITELGYKEPLFATWFALYAAAGIPEEARNALVPAIEKAVKATKERVDKMGSLCEYKSPAELRKMTEEEYRVGVETAKKMNLTPKK
jgi:tripartite-type tricarboxylate transporter receptor subunit TctC